MSRILKFFCCGDRYAVLSEEELNLIEDAELTKITGKEAELLADRSKINIELDVLRNKRVNIIFKLGNEAKILESQWCTIVKDVVIGKLQAIRCEIDEDKDFYELISQGETDNPKETTSKHTKRQWSLVDKRKTLEFVYYLKDLDITLIQKRVKETEKSDFYCLWSQEKDEEENETDEKSIQTIKIPEVLIMDVFSKLQSKDFLCETLRQILHEFEPSISIFSVKAEHFSIFVSIG